MIELLSYWKATCSPHIYVKTGNLLPTMIPFWKKLYYHGLGEFFYCNQIHTNRTEFTDIVVNGNRDSLEKPTLALRDETIVPVGGGKDSVVTLEALRASEAVMPMIINPRKATLATIQTAGFENDFLEIQRNIDPLLLQLNQEGFLNGHTPFSAMLAFYAVLLAIVSGKKHIALSNESSANESTVQNSDVNHQYSKSYEFETDFRKYVNAYLSEEVNYYSFLRPLSELQIAALFAQNTNYLSVFKSCNVGSKTDVWCCDCAKCLFTFIILSPFISPAKLTAVYGENLFEKEQLLPVLKELCGLTPEKPFECVGTVTEVCLALVQAVRKYATLPALLHYFADSPLYKHYSAINFEKQMNRWETSHFLPEKEFTILKNYLNQSYKHA
jgi:hypothetical protein